MTAMRQNQRHHGDFYRLTGEVIRGWAALELSLSGWLIDLLSIDELRSRIIWDSYGDFRGKTTLLKTLTRNFAEECLWPTAKAIFEDVERIAGNRYILPHAFGEVDGAESRLVFRSEKHDADYLVNFVDERSVDTAVLERWLGEIREVQNRVRAFKQELAGGIYQHSLVQRQAANA